MTDGTKQLLEISLELLKKQMKDSGVILALAVDRLDVDNSKICFIDKEQYLNNGKANGISISLTDFNKGLM